MNNTVPDNHLSGRLSRLLVALLVLGAVLCLPAQEASPNQSKVDLLRLALLTLQRVDVPANATIFTQDHLRQAFTATGLYEVIPEEEMAKRYQAFNLALPSNCNSEKCLVETGLNLAASKIIVGELVHEKDLFILQLKSFNVEKRDFDSRVKIASQCSEAQLKDMAFFAVHKLLGLTPPASEVPIWEYRGQEVNNKLQWAVMGGATLAAGLAWLTLGGAKNATLRHPGDTVQAPVIPAENSYILGVFEDAGIGARAAGMGGAYVGLSNDALGVIYNPAGLVRQTNRQIVASWHRQFSLAPYTYIGYTDKITRTLAHGQAFYHSGDDDGLVSETAIMSSISKMFEDLHPALRPSVGATVKLMSASFGYGRNDTSYATQHYASVGGGTGFGFDLGTQWELADRILFGLVLRNVYSSLSYHNATRNADYSEQVPPKLIFGGSYQVNVTTTLVLDGEKGLPLWGGPQDPEDSTRTITEAQDFISGGVESLFFNVLMLRFGISQAFSLDPHRRYAGGMGLNWEYTRGKRVMFDYAYEYFHLADGFSGLSGIHRFSLGLNF